MDNKCLYPVFAPLRPVFYPVNQQAMAFMGLGP
jgi:hypothetical protein